MNTQPDTLLAGAATIRGDLRDLMLQNLAAQTKIWRDMPQAEQVEYVKQIDHMCGALVTQIAVLVATQGRPAVLATLDRVTADAECRATLIVPKDQAGALIGSTKQIVAIMQPTPNAFLGERGPAATIPDQPSLPIAPAQPTAAATTIPAATMDVLDRLLSSDAERCVPETTATLMHQQQALIEGRRACQMFPTGTTPLPLPKGMDEIETKRGVFHFNPDEIDAVSIVSASDAGEENLLLNLGPYSKAEVMREAMKGGKDNELVCVVERAESGEEVLAAVTVAKWADEIKALMEKHMADGSFVAFTTPSAVVNERLRINAVGIADAAEEAVEPARAKPAARPKKPAAVKPASKPKLNGHDTAPPSKSASIKKTGSPFAS